MVELIVVLVIVAVVAAFLVPALLGFIDKGRESEYKAHAQAALSATQTALSDIYNDGGNSYTPTKRENTRVLAGASESTAFTIWTDDVLWDGRTVAIDANIGSYTIVKAIYKENDDVYMYYDGANWTKYDTERKAMAAAVGTGADGKLKAVGNNIVYVWPYQRDFAYLEGETEYHGSDTEGPEIKVVTFHTDERYASRSFFKRVGKGGSGKESVKVVFWKEGDEYKSYWDGQYFVENENYKYEFDAGRGMNFEGWIPRLYAVAEPFTTPNDVINYIYNIETDKNEFDLDAVLSDNEGWAEKVILSKSEFGSFCAGKAVNGMNKVAGDKYTKESVLSVDGAVRVDDGSQTNGVLYAWFDGSTGEINWWTNAEEAYLPADCSDFFTGNESIVSLDFTGFLGSETTTSSGMFYGCTALTNITLGGGLADAAISDTSRMFEGCENLSSIDLANIGTSGLTDVGYMFAGCSSLTSIAMDDSFDTSTVESLEGMFENCSSLTTLEIGGWNTSNVTSLEKTFKGCTSLGTIDMSSWDLGKVVSLKETFSGLTDLTTLNMGDGWNLSSCASLENTFYGCSLLTSMDMGKLGLSDALINLSGTFRDCSGLANIVFPEGFDTKSVTNMENLFNGCSSITKLDLKSFDTHNVTGFTGMFNGMTNLTTIYATVDFVVNSDDVIMFEGDERLFGGTTHYSDALSNKDTSKYAWIDMRDDKAGYFHGVYFKAGLKKEEFQKLFTQKTTDVVKVDYEEHETARNIFDVTDPDPELTSDGSYIYAWRDGNTVKWCTNAMIAYMPYDCSRFFYNNTNLYKFSFRGFDTSKVTTMEDMFGCNADSIKSNLSEIDFGDDFRTDSLENLHGTFRRCIKITTLDLSNWNVSKVTNLTDTFARCKALTDINVSGWDVSNVTSMQSTFRTCLELTYLDLSTWHTDSLETMQQMFFESSKLKTVKFDNWNAENLNNVFSTFNGCKSLETIDLSGWDTRNIRSTASMFNGCSKLTTVDMRGWTTVGIDGTKAHSVTDTSTTSGYANMFNGCSSLTTIYETQDFVFVVTEGGGSMFNGCNSLVGGAGTRFSTSGNGSKYIFARIDDPENDKKGYFTYKALEP